MTAKRLIICALFLVVQGLLFALLAAYLFQAEAVSNVRIVEFAVLLVLFNSGGMWLATRAKVTNNPAHTFFRISLVVIASTIGCSLLAELLFGPGGSRKIGVFNLVVAVPIVLALFSPSERKQVNQVADDR